MKISVKSRVRPIPGMIPIPGTDTRCRYLYEKMGMNPVSVWVRYGGYGGYRYRFGIEDMDMGYMGIGNPVSYWAF